jgi:pimeloyl-ACP methyl ester carboxylesterase
MADELIPFRVDVAEAELEDLRERVRLARWPEPETVDDWSQGAPLGWLRELCRYWVDGYDWRVVEGRLNALPQWRTRIDGLDVHLVHVRSPHPGALPLVLTNGWPGSIVEYLDVIGPLTNPPDPADAFDVVCPALPGYGFSGRPTGPGWGVERTATAWAELMRRLGYPRYGAHGSDWGNSVTTSLGQQDPGHLAGIHVAPPIAAPDPATFGDLTPAERESLADLEHAGRYESGYSAVQATKPQTVGYGLVDSPVALCAWIAEKYRSWADVPVGRDALLDTVTLYWLTGTGASSARMYWESFERVSEWFTRSTVDTVDVPAGCTVWPKDVPRPSRRWAARRYTDIRFWREPDRGGHFAALEQPELFVEDLRSFFRTVR